MSEHPGLEFAPPKRRVPQFYPRCPQSSVIYNLYGYSSVSASNIDINITITRRLHRRSLRLPTRREWAQSGYLCTTPSTAQAGADAEISWS